MNRALLVGLLALAGCGGADDPGYRDMSPYLAASRSRAVANELVADPSSPYYNRSLDYVDVQKGHNQAGREAWVGVFTDPAGERVCIAVWTDPRKLFTYESDYGPCGGAPAV